jgi:hypothetical protein
MMSSRRTSTVFAHGLVHASFGDRRTGPLFVEARLPVSAVVLDNAIAPAPAALSQRHVRRKRGPTPYGGQR